MAYSDFTLAEVERQFALTVDYTQNLFAPVSEKEPSDLLKTLLTENVPLALAVQTEKARSELIIAPILMEVRRSVLGDPTTTQPVSLFSGVRFDVDAGLGLTGVCDYLLTRSATQFYIQRPVLAVIEAKKEDIVGGLGQCIAAMVAAKRFNEQNGEAFPVHGAVTTGDIWKFLRLNGNTVFVDVPNYYLDRLPAILGVLATIVS